jgi:hypothetical protein
MKSQDMNLRSNNLNQNAMVPQLPNQRRASGAIRCKEFLVTLVEKLGTRLTQPEIVVVQ